MVIDLLFVIILVLAAIKGYQRGLIIGFFSLVAIIIGLAAAMKLSAVVAIYIGNTVKVSERWLPIISFVVVFIIVVLLVRLGANFIEKIIEVASFGWLNRLGGVTLYAVIFTIVYSIILFYGEQMKIIQPTVIKNSATYSFIQPWAPKAINGLASIVPFFKDMFTDLQTFFGGVADSISQ
jgi:membrane protein required for colicin V production